MRPVVAPVSRASATTSRSSSLHRRERVAGGRAQGEQHRALGERRSHRRVGAATITRSATCSATARLPDAAKAAV